MLKTPMPACPSQRKPDPPLLCSAPPDLQIHQVQRHAAVRQLSPRTFLRLRPRRTYAAPIALSSARVILRQGVAPVCQPSGGPVPTGSSIPTPPCLSELASKSWSLQGCKTGQGRCPCQAFIVPGRGGGSPPEPTRQIPAATLCCIHGRRH